MTNDTWYRVEEATKPITQGDLILECPVLSWASKPLVCDAGLDLRAASETQLTDVVVMTQACDLEQAKVPNVALCKHWSLTTYKQDWESAMNARNQNPSERAWRSHCEDIRDGYVWNLAMLNACVVDPLKTEHRVVDFREVYTVPRSFLESFLRQRGEQRLQLLPPYREHLSQAFARFFMRVGLPTPVAPTW